MSAHFFIRPATETDKDYIAKTWWEVFRTGSYELSRVRPSALRPHIAPRIDRALAKGCVTVAAPWGDESTVLGFLVYETGPKPILHIVYVKSAFRRMGIGRALLGGLLVSDMAWSTMSQDVRTWIGRKVKLGEHVPLWVDTDRRALSDG